MHESRKAYKTAPDKHATLLKVMTLALVFPVIYTAACQAPPRRHTAGPDSDIEAFLAERRESGKKFADTSGGSRPPASVAPDYTISNIPDTPRSVQGNLHRRPARNWKYIVIHHSGTESGSMESFDRHARRNRGWKGVGYHFVIGNGEGTPNGTVEVTFRWEEQIQGAHAGVKEYNEHGIGICLVGDFDSGYPSREQMKSLASLVAFLQKRNNIPASEIYMHRDVKNTACPGKNFPFYMLLALLRQ